MRKKPAIVRFVGVESKCTLGCGATILRNGQKFSYKFCNQCPVEDCTKGKSSLLTSFKSEKTYKAYLVDMWEGEWTNLSVKDETGEVTNFNDISDFEIVSDPDRIFSTQPAKLKCTRSSEYDIFGVNEGSVYECIGYSWQDEFVYYVADESYGTFPYSPEYFEIIDDPDGVLEEGGVEVFWWDYPDWGEPIYKDEIGFTFDIEANGAAYFKITKHGREPRKIERSHEIESFPGFVMADYSKLGEIPEGVEILSFDSNFKDRIFERKGSYWLTIGSIPPINLELPDEALAVLGIERTNAA